VAQSSRQRTVCAAAVARDHRLQPITCTSGRGMPWQGETRPLTSDGKGTVDPTGDRHGSTAKPLPELPLAYRVGLTSATDCRGSYRLP
jgi:hypothetical protein